jgi:hypothetical protein
MAETGKYFSNSNQLDWMELVTWNDYEEGTAIEMGIDNCVSVAASISGSMLSWSLSGQPNTVDHLNIFISLDGLNLMPLATLATSSRSLDLSSFSLAAGGYTLYVQAAGRPSLTNKISGPVKYSVANQPPTVALTATPTSGTATLLVSASTAGSMDPDGSIASTTLDFGDGTVLTAASGSHSYTKSGTFILKAVVTDNLGTSSTASATITVAPPIAATTVVNISSPVNNAAITRRSVAVIAAATSNIAISSMQIYVDGAKVYQVSGGAVNKTVNVSTGSHAITVQSTDSNGGLAQSSVNVTVK